MTVKPRASKAQTFRCGYVAITGRPNVGKSTLLNRLLGQKLSITSRRPQTTRWNLLGIKTGSGYQAVYVDTPGIQNRSRGALNRFMNKEVGGALASVDLILFLVEALKWTKADAHALQVTTGLSAPVLLVINKIDQVKDRSLLLPFMERLAQMMRFVEIIPVSARRDENLDRLKKAVVKLLPAGPPSFPEDQLSDRNERFFAAEMIREKLTRRLGAEVPYRLSVTIDQFRESGAIVHIHATIWVETSGQKAIVIGRQGRVLKCVGEDARRDMESMFGRRVNLHTWVKVKRGWTADARVLQQLGYNAQRG